MCWHPLQNFKFGDRVVCLQRKAKKWTNDKHKQSVQTWFCLLIKYADNYKYNNNNNNDNSACCHWGTWSSQERHQKTQWQELLGKINNTELQKIALLGSSHILRKVLSIEWSACLPMRAPGPGLDPALIVNMTEESRRIRYYKTIYFKALYLKISGFHNIQSKKSLIAKKL